MRSPLTAMVFVLELTHDLNVLPGLLIACIAADAVTVLFLRRSILTEKVARHGHHILREYVVDPFGLMRVGKVMDKYPATIPDTPAGYAHHGCTGQAGRHHHLSKPEGVFYDK